ITSEFPVSIDSGVRFGIVQTSGLPFSLVRNEKTQGAWQFDGRNWRQADELLAGLDGVFTLRNGADRGVRLRDLDGDGRCELIVSNDKQNAVFRWDPNQRRWN